MNRGIFIKKIMEYLNNNNLIVKCKNNHNVGEFYLLKYSYGQHTFKYGQYAYFLNSLSICDNFGADFRGF